jgi:hypothetical protein
MILTAPTRRVENSGPGLATESHGGLTMADSRNRTNPRGFPPWRNPCTRIRKHQSREHTTTTRWAFLASVTVAATMTPPAAATATALSGLAPGVADQSSARPDFAVLRRPSKKHIHGRRNQRFMRWDTFAIIRHNPR